MRRTILFFVVAFAVTSPLPAQDDRSPSPQTVSRMQKEVRHELVMLPYLDVLDNLAYKVDGYNVTLFGQVTQPALKSEAGKVVKKIEGVEKVDNQIEVLPASPFDNRLRLRLYQSIYGYPPLQKYALGVLKPIRIVVTNGRVTLEGVVDSDADKTIAGMRATTVPGISVTK